MRSFVCEPMRYGRLFLAGDSAHIVPPTGAKGMNLAIADVRVQAAAMASYFRNGSSDMLDTYSQVPPADMEDAAFFVLYDRHLTPFRRARAIRTTTHPARSSRRTLGRALTMGERLRSGILHINEQTVADDIINPFGGVGASGNGTSVGGLGNADEYSQWRWVTIKTEAPRYPV